MKLFLLSLLIMSITSCNKAELTKESDVTRSLTCSNITKATVKKQMLNQEGTDYFLYLELDEIIGQSTSVFPDNIPTDLQHEGKRISLNYSVTKDVHTYVLCDFGHTYPLGEANNPVPLTMTSIQVCKASATN